ncbi:uncharacterized protein [Aegilops tauschii subsp. strangulata]|nr:uncharacterized protein LOC109761299 [Aegilops tauschii subsp. strangulata]XP_040248286.1 uncharacterized protein LOC109761299 [Aegilops tauschii subsp. strangulata]XP_040248287.1 uncharacterized protein LOC109761299 [Aegilops tauschii subsp. strangulata]XP_045085791.1 uncharacterized protein LOC109761299 [Aegilops tauschii subsp. strangulata]
MMVTSSNLCKLSPLQHHCIFENGALRGTLLRYALSVAAILAIEDLTYQVSAAPNGRLNDVVASPNPQVSSAGQWATIGQQEYKNANMYAGADPYVVLLQRLGDYSVYVGVDGAESFNPGNVLARV